MNAHIGKISLILCLCPFTTTRLYTPHNSTVLHNMKNKCLVLQNVGFFLDGHSDKCLYIKSEQYINTCSVNLIITKVIVAKPFNIICEGSCHKIICEHVLCRLSTSVSSC